MAETRASGDSGILATVKRIVAVGLACQIQQFWVRLSGKRQRP